MRLRAFVRGSMVALAGAAVVFAGPAAQPASADPTLDDAKDKLAAIEQEQSEIGEQWAEVKLQLTEGKTKVETLNADIAAQQRKVNALRKQAQQVTISRFRTAASTSPSSWSPRPTPTRSSPTCPPWARSTRT